MSIFYEQLKAVTWRNYQLKKANKSKTFQEIFLPLYMIVLLYFFKYIFKSVLYERVDSTDLIDIKNYTQFNEPNTLIGFVLPEEETNDDIISMVMNNQLFANTTIGSRKFKNENELEQFNTKGDQKLMASVIFNNDFYNYTIRINGTNIVDPKSEPVGIYGNSRANEGAEADTYLKGFVPVQIAVDQAIIRMKTNDNTLELATLVGKMSKNEINYSSENALSSKIFSLYMTFLFVMHITLIITYIVTEKEKKKKEGLLMVGVHPVVFWLSWEIIYFIIIAITSVIIVVFFIATQSFTRINFILFFLLIFIYGISNCSIGFMISTIFKKAQTASACASFVTILLSGVYMGVSYISDDLKIIKYIIALIFSPVSMGMAMEEVYNAEDYQKDLGFGSLFSTDFGKYFFILIFNNILYFILTVVMDGIFDSKTLFRKKNNNLTNIKDDEDIKSYSKDIQEDPKVHEKLIVEVTNLYKKFKKVETEGADTESENEKSGFFARFKKTEKKKKDTFLAVNDVSFKVYQSEIFAILGHNGAGKTTLIQMMVGLLNSDCGTTYFDGLEINKNLNKIRRDFGICTQNNILFDDLTVEDHIKIFAGIKGVKPNVDEILQEIDLVNQKNQVVVGLSGGQKRKLCIGLAIIGNPKYIFLDEPTTGLDPLSRRKIWDLLLSKKKDRVIFLTTHYMDEADILADRKLILNKGKIRCLGSSIYLKTHFKMKYNLDVETTSRNDVTEIIQRYIPEASFFSDKTELISRKVEEKVTCYTWKLPISSTTNFAPLLDELEMHTQNENDSIKKFALYMPSLEELFIRLEDETHEENDETENENEDTLLLKNYEELPKLKSVEKPSSMEVIKCLIKYRLKIFFNNKSFALNAIFLPVVFSLVTFVIVDLLLKNQNVTYKPRNLSANDLYMDNMWNYDIEGSNFNNTINQELVEKIFPQSKSISTFTYEATNKMDEIESKVIEKPYYVASFFGNLINNRYTWNIHYNDSMVHSLPSTINALSNSILASKNVNEKINVSSYPFSYANIMIIPVVMLLAGIYIGISLSSGISFFGPLIVRERCEKLLKQLQLNGVSRRNYWISALMTDTFLYLVSCMLIVLSGVIYGLDAFRNVAIIAILIVTLIIWAVASIFFQYILSFLFSKEETAYQYMTIFNLIPSYIGVIAFTIVNAVSMDYASTTIYSLPAVMLEFVLTIVCPPYGIIGVLCAVFSLQSYNTAAGMELNFENYFKFGNGITPILIALLISVVLSYFILIFLDKKKNKTNASDINQHSQDILKKNEDIIENGDEDVLNEFRNVKANCDKLPICVKQVSKEYKVKRPENKIEKEAAMNNTDHTYGQIHMSEFNKRKFVKTAVEDVSFGINGHECFGLLGPNGAGKSTLLNIITATLPQTTGDVLFNGSKTHETDIVDLSLGYCPQNDILWKELTLIEHIEMFLRIRGYSIEDANEYAKKYIKSCGLDEHKTKRANKLSGGTKRKLSLLVAICGNSQQIMLDEPTAGMDPSTRRFVWNIVKDVIQSNKTAMIMTTHSMEEAENLCTRIGILINGRLICIGSPEHLKLKYGDGYILEVQSNYIDKFNKEIIEGNGILGKDYIYERQSNDRAKYEVKLKSGLGSIFNEMEKCKKMELVEDYNFSQTSLEQIFINFAKQQIIDETEHN